ncbi:MAG: prepilin peptidase [Bacillota bacterium]
MYKLIPLVFLLAASWTDVKKRKINNHITYPLAALGLLMGFLISGGNGLHEALIGMTVAGGLLCIVPGFMHGGGDLKLAGACGAWIGIGGLKYIMAFVAIALALVCLCNIIFLVRNEGWIGIRSRVSLEIVSAFRLSQPTVSLPMAPFMLLAYAVVMII